MKNSSIIKIILFFQYINILCEVNITEIFSSSFSKLKYLPVESTIYFSRNIKCMSYLSVSTSICLIYNKLYIKNEGTQYYLISEISGYSDSYYFDLTYIKYTNTLTGCLLFYFTDSNNLVIDTYFVNSYNNGISYHNVFNYYNESMNPINNDINCHQINEKLKCFYINKTKDLIEMDIIVIPTPKLVTATFKTAKFKDSNFINNNTIIMSSIINDNKYKYFLCSDYFQAKTFDIFMEKEGNLTFSPTNQDSVFNEFKKYNFDCENREKLLLFGIFNILLLY